MEETMIEVEREDAITDDGIPPWDEEPSAEEAPSVEEAEEQSEIPTVEELDERRQLLEERILELEGELERKKAETDKKACEYAEFKELYPNVDVDELDPEVNEMVNNGVPLAAAYALYEKKQEKRNSAAAAHNKTTKNEGFGSLGKNTENEFFTPDEVRAMTRADVRKNYQRILRSMENWH